MDLSARLRAVCDLDVAIMRENSGRHEYDGKPQDLSPGGVRTGLARLAAVSGVRQVVPGHGHVGDAAEFRRRLAADSAYLDALGLGQPFDDPRITRDWMRDAHEEHLRYVRR